MLKKDEVLEIYEFLFPEKFIFFKCLLADHFKYKRSGNKRKSYAS